MSDDNAVISKSFNNLTNLLGHQLFTKLVTFGLNVVVVRHLEPAVFGAYSVELTLLYTVCLFLRYILCCCALIATKLLVFLLSS